MFEKLNIIKPHEGFQLVTNKFVPSGSDHTYFMEVSHITLGIVFNIYIYTETEEAWANFNGIHNTFSLGNNATDIWNDRFDCLNLIDNMKVLYLDSGNDFQLMICA